MTRVIVATEQVTFTWHEIQWLTFYVWLIENGRCSEFPRIGSN